MTPSVSVGNSISDVTAGILDHLRQRRGPGYGNGYSDLSGTRWNNPDHLVGGRLGELFFMAELWKRTHQDDIWNDIIKGLQQLEAGLVYSHNYALHFGRMGVGYLYLELYRLSGEAGFLSRAASIAREYFAGPSFGYKVIDDPSLYNGLSGIIWFCLQLWVYSRETWLVPFIEKLVRSILHKAQPGQAGIYWGGVKDLFQRNTGLIYGASGIALSLYGLGKCTGNDFFYDIAASALQYEDAVYAKAAARLNVKSGRRLSLGYGIAGIAITRLYLQDILEDGSGDEYWNLLLGTDPDDWTGREAWDMVAGLPGIGLAFAESYIVSGNEKHRVFYISLADRLLSDANALMSSGDNNLAGLLHAGWFLLRYQNTEREVPGTIFTPLLAGKEIAGMDWPTDSLLSPGNHELAGILEKDPRRTRILAAMKEKAYPDEKVIIRKISGKLAKGMDNLLSCTLLLADNLYMEDGDGVLPLDKQFSLEEFIEVFNNYGTNTQYYRINATDGIDEFIRPGVTKIILDRFRQPRRVDEVQKDIAGFLLHQNDDILALLRSRPILETAEPAATNEELMQQIRQYVLEVVWQRLLVGILEITE